MCLAAGIAAHLIRQQAILYFAKSMKKVQLHFEVAGINVSIIELFELVSRRNNYLTWKPVADLDWLETELIIDCVIYNQLPDGKVSCLLPFELR